MYHLKATTADNSVTKQIAKLMLYSLYGRFGLTVEDPLLFFSSPSHLTRVSNNTKDLVDIKSKHIVAATTAEIPDTNLFELMYSKYPKL